MRRSLLARLAATLFGTKREASRRGRLARRRRFQSETLESRDLMAYDFMGTGFDVTQGFISPGATVEVSYKVSNLVTITLFDGSASPDFNFYLSSDNNVTPADVLIGTSTKTWSFFAPGDAVETLQLTLPNASNSVWSGGSGNYTIGMVIDVAGEVFETNEANNSNVGAGLDKESVFGVVGTKLTVTATGDSPVDNIYVLSNLELREAITLANGSQVDTIDFDSDLTSGDPATITLNGTQLPTITQDLTIAGPGADKLEINGDGKSRVFDVKDGSDTSLIDVSISGLTIRNGRTVGGLGAGVANTENLTLTGVVVSNNQSDFAGGGVDSNLGSLTIVGSTIANNVSGGNGGGLGIGATTVTIINTTITGNSATGEGGGIRIFTGPATIRNSTITGNRSDTDGNGGSGGGLRVGSNTTSLFNTIVAGNVRGIVDPKPTDDVNGTLTAASAFNLISTNDPVFNGGLSNGVNGNIVANIPLASILQIETENVGGTTPVHPLVPGSLAIDRGSNSQALNAAGNTLGADQHGRKRISDGNADGTARVDIGAFESLPPVFTGFGGSLTYTENASPILLSTNVTVTDVDDQFLGVSAISPVIRISLSQPHATDRLSIREDGDVSVSGNTITVDGDSSYATFTGGVGQALVITVNPAEFINGYNKLLRHIQFSAEGENPPASVRNVRFQVTDTHGATGFITKQLTVRPVNDKPVLTLSGGLNYNENASPLVLAGSAILTDVDSFNFGGGSLTVNIGQNGSADDRLAIRNQGTGSGQIGVSGNNVTFGGTVIGTFSGGTATNPLVVDLNVACSKAAAQALVRNITFRVLSENPTTLRRRVDFVIVDGDGNGASDLRSKFVTVQPRSDGPTITGLADSSYTANGAFLLLAPNVTVTDPDSTTFNYAKLTVSLTGGTDNDRLSVQTFGTGATQVKRSGEDVTFGGVKVAKLSGGIGTEPLLITFNSVATLEAMQAVTRSIGFRILSGNTGAATRTLGLRFTDGGGGLGALVISTITIQ